MSEFVFTVLGRAIGSLVPAGLHQLYGYVGERWFHRVPAPTLTELNLYLKNLFPEQAISVTNGRCNYLRDSRAFFTAKQDIMASLGRDERGKVDIVCRLPWLVHPKEYNDMYLSSTEAQAYYAMLEPLAGSGKLRYLYSASHLRGLDLAASIKRGIEKSSYPMIMNSTLFDIMLVNTNKFPHHVLFATRPIGKESEEIAVCSKDKAVYLALRKYFDTMWTEASEIWPMLIASSAEDEVAKLLGCAQPSATKQLPNKAMHTEPASER